MSSIENNERTIKIPKSPFNSSIEQGKCALDLQCPFCSNHNISINEVHISSNKALQGKITCDKCDECKDKKIDLEKYVSYIASSSAETKKCFKHKDLVGNIYCKNCELAMCNICYSYHLAFEPSHQTLYGNDENDFCDYHPQQNLDFFCENCNVNLCAECGRKFHCGHNVIQLREYWEKVNSRIKFKNYNEVDAFLRNELCKFDTCTKEQIATIDKFIFSFQQLKLLLENNHRIAMKNNKLTTELIGGIYSAFFQCKYYPKFHLIQNAEKININLLVSRNDLSNYNKIIDGITQNFHILAEFHSNMTNKLLLSEKQRTKYVNIANVNEMVINNNNKSGNQMLKRKRLSMFKTPNDAKNNIAYASHHISTANNTNNTNNTNIIMPIKVTAPMVGNTKQKVKKSKDVFTFDSYICSKYITNNNNNTNNNNIDTHLGDSTINCFESFSNTSSMYETYDCIQLGKVEDNQIIQKYKKKKMEQTNATNQTNNMIPTQKDNNNITSQETTNHTNTNNVNNKNINISTNININTNSKKDVIINNTSNNNITSTESAEDDADFFNKLFGTTNMNETSININEDKENIA